MPLSVPDPLGAVPRLEAVRGALAQRCEDGERRPAVVTRIAVSKTSGADGWRLWICKNCFAIVEETAVRLGRKRSTGFLGDGITSRDAPTFTHASMQVSLSSRIACVGPNGAGKSTLIKVLTGETEAPDGTVW